jgi:hypothetical protein
MKTGAKAGNRRADQTENAVFGVLLAAFMGVSPFVANVAGRRADVILSRAAQAQQATLRQVPATLLQAAPGRGRGAERFRIRPRTGRARTGCSGPAGSPRPPGRRRGAG